MKHKRTITMTSIVLALLLGLVMQVMAAGPIPVLRLPEYTILAHHYTGTQGTYFDVLLGGVGAGYDVQDGVAYPGHCIDRNSSGGTYDGAKLFSSYDPDMPPDVKPLPWGEINYLINHKLGTAQEIQYAIEVLIYGNSIWFPWTQTAQDMIDAANANADFVPGPGQVMAVIVWKNGLGQAPFPGDEAQDSIIEVPVPELGALGDYVWYDQDADGIQDANEPGINGVTVRLYDCAGKRVAITVTADDASGNAGYYLFDNLAAGCYYVQFVPPGGYVFSPQNQGADDAVDSDPKSNTGWAGPIDLAAGERDLTWDAGLYRPVEAAALGDYVWEDLDADGIQDEDEPGINGVTVRLYDCAEPANLLANTTTADDASGNAGYYLFDDLTPGCYEVEFVVPSGYTFSPQDQGVDDAADSDANPTSGRTGPIDLAAGETDRTWDAGLYQPAEAAALGDYVWYDQDADGIQDEDEPGINGMTVRLYDCAANRVAITVTADDASGNAGYYLFDNLAPGCYYVQFVVPEGYVVSPQDQGTDDGVDSDPKPTTGWAGPIDLAAGERDLTWDAGLYRPAEPAALGDYVWEDLDGDGIQDANEPGINGVTVRLYDCAGNLLASTTTADDASGNAGYYLFDDLAPGCYEVEFVVPSGYAFSPQDQGTDDGADSDADQTTGRTGPIDLEAGETDRTWDAGLYQPAEAAALGDYVWYDQDADGIQDEDESGINGMTVRLYDCAANRVAITVTADDASGNAGYYLFDNLAPGCYYVQFVVPEGYVVSPQDQGTDDGVDSDPKPTTGWAGPIDLAAGERDLTWDAGLYGSAALGDYVWEDLDADGIQDANEPGINGVTVVLYDCDGTPVASTTTADDASGNAGYYLFDGLMPGCYELEFVVPEGYVVSPQDQGTDDGVDSDANPTSGRTGPIDLEAGETDRTWDAGLYGSAALGDYVWQDLDADGIQDENEPGINGVTVVLYDCDGNPVASTVTADDGSGNAGYYLFEGLMPGCYEVEFVVPAGYVVSPQDQGTDDGADSDANPTSGRTGPIDLEAGETDRTWDAGLYLPECGLVLEKLCTVPVAPTEFVCSDAKPIDELTMVWNGTQTVRVVAWYGAVGSSIVGTVDGVAPGDVVTISGFAGSPNDVYWEIFDAASEVKIGESTFHLSCSDDDMNGPEDCGLPEGDGKDKTGYLNDWLLEGMAGANGMALVCTPQPQPGSDTCEAVLPPAPNCETLGRPYELTFRFTGETCAASDNDQGDKFKCTDVGAIDPTHPVEIVYTGKDPNLFTVTPATVSVGEEVTIEATGRDEFHAETMLEIRQGGVLKQSLNIHTSCSAPLEVGDVFASLELVRFNGQGGPGAEVIYTYEVLNIGSALVNVNLDDSVLGHIAGPFELASGESRTFQETAYLLETTTSQATVAGVMANGYTCEASDTTTVSIVEPCAECTSRVQAMTLSYTGPALSGPTTVEIDPDKGATVTYNLDGLTAGTVLSMVSQNGWTIDATVSGESELGAKTKIRINGVEEVIHTSCSTPFVAGAPAPLDDPKGDPSPNWFVESFRQK